MSFVLSAAVDHLTSFIHTDVNGRLCRDLPPRSVDPLAKLPIKLGRKAPKRDVVRQLFALSGNQCARPGCHIVLLNANGTLVAEICHIAAESAGGPRFDATLNPEQRRAFANLLLLCSTCHTLVDSEPEKYTVSMLRKWKRDREAMFEEVGDTLRKAYLHEISNESDSLGASIPKHLKAYVKFMAKRNVRPMIDSDTPGEIAMYVKKMAHLTISDRQLVAAIVEKALDLASDDWYGIEVHPDDLKTILVDQRKLSDGRIVKLGKTLQRHNLGSIDNDDNIPSLFIAAPHDGVSWSGLKSYAEAKATDLVTIVRSLKFGILD